MKTKILLAATAAVLLYAAAAANTTSLQPNGETTMTATTKSSMLKVPGASIYYEKQGSGPLLLLIPGGPQDAGVFADLARQLAGRYTVVAYDPRGNSRSVFDGSAEPLSIDVQADDAAKLIESIGSGPAFVFGTSGGAQIGLNLAARYPEQVRALVAHEPPSMMLLDDPSASLAEDQDLYDTYKRAGVDAAMAKFFAMAGLEEGAGGTDAAAPAEADAEASPGFDMSPEEAETFERVSGNFEYWLAHGMLPLSRYTPEVDTLRSGKPRIVVAIGAESAGQPIEAMAVALAERLGVNPVAFPGDHIGFGQHAEAFAQTLGRVLAGN